MLKRGYDRADKKAKKGGKNLAEDMAKSRKAGGHGV